MELKLEKQPRKYLASVDANTRIKLYRALDKLKNLEGNIVRLSGSNDLFRMKIDHYRILFRYSGGQIIVVETINTRTNIKYRRYE
ncbi:MAG: addiction module toxin RelE [Clostridiaceae bacterium]|jgi:mRNA-degrading endonuclease RelE of RelBE toxin-antitoxin system|nr:addiction module toxin RelE [Clostridiaceae bacterium]